MASGKKGSIAISATFSSEPLTESLQFWVDRLKLPFSVKHAAFNQVFQTLLDQVGLFAANADGVNVALIRWQDLGDSEQLENNAKSLIETIARAGNQLSAPLIVLNCPCSPVFLSDPGSTALALRLDHELAQRVATLSNIHLISSASVQEFYPVSNVDDPISERLAQIPYTAEFYAALGTILARKAASLRRSPYKVIVVDLDNTLWTGVAGEDGWQGVRIDGGRLALQELLLKQREQGALLAVCSKNNENDAWEVFERRPEMLLKKQHFSAWQINWDPKSVNIRRIAQQLSLGADSFIFLDDCGKECAEVRAQAPEVLTLQIPASSSDLLSFVRHIWAFDRGKATAEDRLRVESYEREQTRALEAQKAGSLEDFVASLALQVTIEPLRPEMIARVAQLTQRTNQFNTTTIRRTEAELKSTLDERSLQGITVAVTDRFGDYGNVGAVLYNVVSSSLVVDSFMLSCRALGRGVEHAIVRYLGEEAQRHQAEDVVIRFIASPKNALALRFLDSLESTGESGGLYTRSFRIKADYATQLVYRPLAGSENEQLQKVSQPELRASAVCSAAIDYSGLAASLNTVSAIRAEICKSKPAEEFEAASSATPGSAAPRNDTEAELVKIWAEVLQKPTVGIHDDFFELGGTSLRAVGLLVRVVETFDRPDLVLSMVLEAPTVARFAVALGNQQRVRCLVPIREQGSRPPFFCIPGVGGNVLGFRGMAAHLPEDQPFYGLQAPGLDGSETVDDAKRIAAMYIEEIRTIQPQGPYFLGGGCIGGIFALEMAQQLRAQGEEVAFLALMDAYNPAYSKMISRFKYFYCHGRFLGQRAMAKASKIARRFLSRHGEQRRNHNQPISPLQSNRKDSVANDPLEILRRVHDANLRAGQQYTPLPYKGKITVFRAATRKAEPYQDNYLGWGPVAKGGIDVEVIPGRHSDYEPRVHAQMLDQHLRLAQNMSLQSKTAPTNSSPWGKALPIGRPVEAYSA
jgi:FkbH-like protein